MENIHVLEPIVHICAIPLHSGASGESAVLFGGRPQSREAKDAGSPARDYVLRLLDRLKLFSAPRIVSAECVIPETMAAGAPCRQKTRGAA
jgi:hypothetical protein